MKRLINIYSEVNSLKKVLLHRPGNEMLNLTPANYQELLYRDIPDLVLMQKEHDAYANFLRKEGVDVLYLTDLVVECLNSNPNVRNKFIKQFIKEANIKINDVSNQVYNLLNSIKDNRKLINKCIEGIRSNEIVFNNKFYNIGEVKDLVVEPMVNLCFIGDLASGIGNGVSLNKMASMNRFRESIFLDYIFKYHPKYKNVNLYFNRYESNYLEGGDFWVLNDEVLCVGVSERTDVLAIATIAKKVLNDGHFKYVLAIDSKNYRFEHLDTVMSMVDYDKFLVYNEFIKDASFYELTLYNGDLVINEFYMPFDKVLAKYLHLEKVTLIKSDNIDLIDAKREQWQGGFNVFGLMPGVVLAYKHNQMTNKLLKEHGIKVIEVLGNNLLKGSGGPRSLAVSLIREK